MARQKRPPSSSDGRSKRFGHRCVQNTTQSSKPRVSHSETSGEKVKVLARTNRTAVQLYTTGIWPSIACGVRQYGLSPSELEKFEAQPAAAYSCVAGHQDCPVTAIGIGMGQQHQPRHPSRPLDFLLVAPTSPNSLKGVEASSFSSPIRQVSMEASTWHHVERRCKVNGLGLDSTRTRLMEIIC